jgi:hypothetical protein
VTGTVKDASTGQPIVGATVNEQNSPNNHPFNAVTDTNGNFTLIDSAGKVCVPSGTITIQAGAETYQDIQVSPIVPSSGNINVPIQLPWTKVSGKVVDANNSPVPSRAVIIHDLTNNQSVPPGSTMTLPDGTFTFNKVKHVTVKLLTRDIEYRNSTPPSIDLYGITVHPIGVPPGNITLKLKPTVPPGCINNISGQVTDDYSNSSLSAAIVSVENTSPTVQNTTSSTGSYTLNIPNGNQTLLVEKECYNPGEKTVDVPLCSNLTLNFQLKRYCFPLHNTGVDTADVPLSGGKSDPHWFVVSGLGITSPIPAFVVTNQHPSGRYFATTDSSWIWAKADGSGSTNEPYTFRLSFDLTGIDYTKVQITGSWGADNTGKILLNNKLIAQMPQTQWSGEVELTGTTNINNYQNRHQFSITSGFISGMNTLDFQVTDASNPGGLNVTGLTGNVLP